jgi:thiol-disulfide isomerase/thioredoxin
MTIMRPAALAAALALALPAAAEEEVAEGRPAPSFSLRALDPAAAGAGLVALDRWAGDAPEDPDARVVLLHFFASWCAPCAKELPLLVELDRAWRGRGLRLLGVDIDREEDGIAAARRMVADAGVTWPVLSDRFNFLARRYLGDDAPLPSLFLVRRDGTIARIARGYRSDAAGFLRAEVAAALGLPAEGGAAPAGGARAPARAAGRP